MRFRDGDRVLGTWKKRLASGVAENIRFDQSLATRELNAILPSGNTAEVEA